MTIDEVILSEKCHYNKLKEEFGSMASKYHIQIAEWLEELKTIKEMDLDIPQHFTKEQSYWIMAYCIKRNGEFYNQALEDVTDIASWHEEGLSGYYTITSEELERLKAGGKDENGGI